MVGGSPQKGVWNSDTRLDPHGSRTMNHASEMHDGDWYLQFGEAADLQL